MEVIFFSCNWKESVQVLHFIKVLHYLYDSSHPWIGVIIMSSILTVQLVHKQIFYQHRIRRNGQKHKGETGLFESLVKLIFVKWIMNEWIRGEQDSINCAYSPVLVLCLYKSVLVATSFTDLVSIPQNNLLWTMFFTTVVYAFFELWIFSILLSL